MPPRAWKVLPAVAISILTGTATAPAAETRVASFGNWRIVHISENNSLMMMGTSADPLNYFSLQCFSEPGAATLMIPVYARDFKPVLESDMSFMVWSDGGAAQSVSLTVAKGTVALGIKSFAHPDDNVARFIGALADAKTYFAFSYLGRTVEFDAKFLGVAREKFGEMCQRLAK
jgi:hypothetical protein